MKKNNEVVEWIKSILFALILVFGINYFLFSPIVVDGESMMPTLESGNRMILNKVNYVFKEPERFDIIVYHAKENEDHIKRVIGLPGDRIQYRDDVLYINGEAYEEEYLDEYKNEVTDLPLTGDFTLEDTPVNGQVVPENHLFVMGDNRRHSTDSRILGAVPFEEIAGQANIVVWPLKNIGIIE